MARTKRSLKQNNTVAFALTLDCAQQDGVHCNGNVNLLERLLNIVKLTVEQVPW